MTHFKAAWFIIEGSEFKENEGVRWLFFERRRLVFLVRASQRGRKVGNTELVRKLLITGTTIVALYVTAADAQSVQYTVTDLGILANAPSNGGSYPAAINNLGQAVGHADTYTLYSHAFLYNGSGPLINLGSFGGDSSVSVATGINNSGTVVGYSDLGGSNPTVAFMYTASGGMQALGPVLDSVTSYAWGVSNNGQIVGIYGPPSGGIDGFVYNAATGTMQDLGAYQASCINDSGLVAAVLGSSSGTTSTAYVSSDGTGTWINIGSLGGTFTTPRGMNDLGEVVGGSSVTSANEYQQPFLYHNGVMTALGTFGGELGAAYSVNDSGVVVGYADLPGDAPGSDRAFIYDGSGSIENLNNLIDPTLGWTLAGASGINDSGQILAEGYLPGGNYHAVILTPVAAPEPSSIYLLCTAILSLIAIYTRNRLVRPRRCIRMCSAQSVSRLYGKPPAAPIKRRGENANSRADRTIQASRLFFPRRLA